MRISRIAATVLMLAVGGIVLAGASRSHEPVRQPASQPPKLHAYVTTGDAQWDPRYQPLDSVETVSAFFEHLAEVQHVSRAYWRGGRSLNALNHYVFRPENPVRFEHWTRWQQELNVDLDLNRVAESEAHSRGMEIFLMEALFDLGGTGAAEYGGQLPFFGEDRIRLEHPEWIPVDRWGDRRQEGPLELAYPEARRALIDRFTQAVVDGDYDGLYLYTYVENFSTRFEDEFGFNEPIVAEYRRRYGVDIRTEPFDRAKWGALRGEYVTEFLRGLHQALAARGKKLTIALSPAAPDRTQRWPSTAETSNTAIRLDWRSWVRRGTVDEVLLVGVGDTDAIAFAEELLSIRISSVAVTILTESPLHTRFGPLRARGVTLAGYCAPYRGVMEQFSLTPPKADDLKREEWSLRAQAVVAVGAGTLSAPAATVAALVRDPHVLVRREAIRALVAMGARSERKTIEAALNDPEESVRVAAIGALGTLGDTDSVRAIRAALRVQARFMTKEAAVQALGALGRPVTLPVVLDAVRDPSAAVRQVAVRALGAMATQPDVATIMTVARTDDDAEVRYFAIEALRSWPQPAVATLMLTEASSQSPMLQMRAVRGVLSTAGFLSVQQKAGAVSLLTDLFAQYGEGSAREDADWGWRFVSRVLIALGADGVRALEAFRVQNDDSVLARRAYYALYIPQQEGVQAVGNWDDDERTHYRFAPSSPPPRLPHP